MEHLDPKEVGTWILIFFAIITGSLTIVWLSRQIWVSFTPKQREPDSEFVTRKEIEKIHDDYKKELKDALNHLERTISQFVTRSEHESKFTEMTKRVDQVSEYLHTRLHDLLNNLGAISNKIDILGQLLHREIGRREGLKEKPHDNE